MAVEDLVASYGGRAFRVAIGITRNEADAEEFVQHALWTVVPIAYWPSQVDDPALVTNLGLVLMAAIVALSKE
jgi:DNA-directed RNA polymerase specialized sigma24 family protein